MSRSPALAHVRRFTSPSQLQRGRENHAAIRAQHEQDEIQAIWRKQQMATKPKSPMGFTRTDTRAARAALDAYAELNAALDEAVDEIETAFARERQMRGANGPDAGDLRRAPVLGNRRSVS